MTKNRCFQKCPGILSRCKTFVFVLKGRYFANEVVSQVYKLIWLHFGEENPKFVQKKAFLAIFDRFWPKMTEIWPKNQKIGIK